MVSCTCIRQDTLHGMVFDHGHFLYHIDYYNIFAYTLGFLMENNEKVKTHQNINLPLQDGQLMPYLFFLFLVDQKWYLPGTMCFIIQLITKMCVDL